MKNLLVVFALLVGGAVSARAAADTTFDSAVRAPEPATNITTVKSSETVVGLNISTQPATNVMIDNTQMFRWVDVQNVSGSPLFCGDNLTTLSTGSAVSPAAATGWMIPGASTQAVSATIPWPQELPHRKFDVVPGRPFYCQSGHVSAAQRAIIMRGR